MTNLEKAINTILRCLGPMTLGEIVDRLAYFEPVPTVGDVTDAIHNLINSETIKANFWATKFESVRPL